MKKKKKRHFLYKLLYDIILIIENLLYHTSTLSKYIHLSRVVFLPVYVQNSKYSKYAREYTPFFQNAQYMTSLHSNHSPWPRRQLS